MRPATPTALEVPLRNILRRVFRRCLLEKLKQRPAKMENDERAEAVKVGQARARAAGKHVGRPKAVFRRDEIVRLRDQERLSWAEIAAQLGVGTGTARRAYQALTGSPAPCQNCPA